MTTTPAPLYLVPTFHYDVAYLKPYADYLPACFSILDEALRLLDTHPHYHFLIEQVILLDEYVTRFPHKLPLLQKFAAQARLEVAPGMWVMPDMNHLSAESLYQQTRLGKSWLASHLNLHPRTCWVADCWGHHAQLPQILRDCGFDYYVFWRCMRRDLLQNDFLWQGLDGTTIRSHWLARGYANLRFPTSAEAVNAAELTFTAPNSTELHSLVSALSTYGPSSSFLICNGGDMAHPQASAPTSVTALQRDPAFSQLRFATPTQFLDQVDWPNKKNATGDFNSAFQGTFTSNIRIKQLNRTLTQKLIATESLLAALQNPTNLDPLWKLLLTQQFHDIICGTITDSALQDCYSEFSELNAGLDSTLASLSSPTGTPTLFNPLTFTTTHLLPDSSARITLPPLAFIPLTSAEKLTPTPPPSLPHTFENPFYSATISPQGFLTSLLEKSTHTQLAASAPCPFGALTMQTDYGDLWLNFDGPLNGGSLESALTQNTPDPLDRFSPDSILNHRTIFPIITSARILESSNHHLVVEQSGSLRFWQLGLSFTTRITFTSHSPRIDYQTSFTPTGKHFRIRAAFPTPLTSATTTHEIPAGLQTRDLGEHCAQHFISHHSTTAGLALLNRGTPANNVHNHTLLLTLFRSAAMEYKTQSSDSFNENVPHTFHYALVPHANSLLPAITEALAFNTPPLAVNVPQEKVVALAAPYLEVEKPSVLPLALRRLSETDTQLRLYEVLGHETTTSISLPEGTRSAALTSGLGEPLTELKIKDHQIVLGFRPHQIQTIVFRT